MARSIAGIAVLSYGWITRSRASGTEKPAILELGLSPVVVDGDTVQEARIRTTGADAAEFLNRVYDRLIHLVVGIFQHFVDHGASSANQRSDILPAHGPDDLARAVHVEHADRKVVVHTHRNGGGIHHPKLLLNRIHVGDVGE